MKIKLKLVLLSIIMILVVALTVGINITSNSFINKMLSEEKQLVQLRDLMLQQSLELSKFLHENTPIKIQYRSLKTKIDETNELLGVVTSLELLPSLDSNTSKAFKLIKNLDNLLKKSHEEFFNASDEFISTFDENDENTSLNKVDIYKDQPNYTIIRIRANKLVRESVIVFDTLERVADLLAEQSIIISDVVKEYKHSSQIISLITVTLSILISIVISLFISGTITKSINTLSRSLSVMMAGDFTKKISILSNDELGTLGKEISIFQDVLKKSLKRIKESSIENEVANKSLIKTISESSDVTDEISNNINLINVQMIELDSNLSKSNNDVREISKFTKDLNIYTTEQMSMVEKSTSAISQMIVSISNISSLTDNNFEIIKELQTTARNGDKKLTETTDLIDEINSSVTKINDISEIIQNLSDQTNLLAMNAAIEAAHAGEAGKGFAVVADEIRKLAEASAMNSKVISENLTEITTKFAKASTSGQSTRESFTNINNKIKNVYNALLEVSAGTTELNSGGSQILEAMKNLNNISLSVETKSSEMKYKTENIYLISSNILDISRNVSSAISQANVGFTGVSDSMVSLKSVSDKVAIVSHKINHEINKFKTK